MSSGISSRRNASICHCGEPYQTESVPQNTWSCPRPLISVPIMAAQKRGFDTAEIAKDIGINIASAGFLRDRSKVGHPADTAGFFKLGEFAVGRLEKRAA